VLLYIICEPTLIIILVIIQGGVQNLMMVETR